MKNIFNTMVFIVFLSAQSHIAIAYPITSGGHKLSSVLDGMQVSDKWLAGAYVNWQTGAPSPKMHGKAKKSHCSTFVAAVASKLGIYILRPPEHKETLLANAQYYWLQKQGKQDGWIPLKNGAAAQQVANKGCLVVVARANSNVHKPGHIAVVRPSNKSESIILKEGPQIIQAGLHNYNSATVMVGFKHPKKNPILYFAHDSLFCSLNEGRKREIMSV